MKKVYCKNCRFRIVYSLCRAKRNAKYTPANWLKPGGKTLIQEFCHDINKNNDCPEYKQKWWKFWIKEEK